MLESLALHGFRNLMPLEWSVGEGCNLLLGGNGAGKTSLLEALYVVATTRSFRTSQLRECLQRGDEVNGRRPFWISASVAGSSRRYVLELSFSDEGLEREVDGSSVPLAKYLQPLPVVVWSSEEAEILMGSPERRRRMIDRGLVNSDVSRLAVLSQYRRCLLQKRELLRSGQGGIEEWNHLLAKSAAELVAERAAYIELLDRELATAVSISGLKLPDLSLRYRPSPDTALEGAAAIERDLARVAEEERRRKRPVLGPHRDRLDILWGTTDISEVGSAGEKKALGLLLLRAQAAVLEALGKDAVVLADDVDAELDLERLAAVWKALNQSRQLVVTSNRSEVAEALDVSFSWAVDSGSLTPSQAA